MKVAIAGATGFVGSHLLQVLVAQGHQVIALSRRDLSDQNTDQVQWKTCDLFSQSDLLQSMKGCKAVFYLVHSMLPSARLTQGNFADYDLVLADNFARVAKMLSIEHILYVSGMVPDDSGLSRHLLSRLEVERTLKASGIPVTTLRSGIVLGAEGSSFQIMRSLVYHLPVMVCPSWTQTLSNPVHIDDLVKALMVILTDPRLQGKTYDIGGSTTISYREMMRQLATKMKKKRWFITIPFFSPTISRWWVTLITRAPKALVYPLVGSLKTHMVPSIHRQLPTDADLVWKSFD